MVATIWSASAASWAPEKATTRGVPVEAEVSFRWTQSSGISVVAAMAWPESRGQRIRRCRQAQENVEHERGIAAGRAHHGFRAGGGLGGHFQFTEGPGAVGVDLRQGGLGSPSARHLKPPLVQH